MGDSETRYNLLTHEMRGGSRTLSGIRFEWDGDWYHVSGTATGAIGWRAYKSTKMPVKPGKAYTLSVEFAGGMPDADSYKNTSFQLFSDFQKNTFKSFPMYRSEHVTRSFDQATLDGYGAGFQIWGPIIKGGATVDLRVRWMLVEGDTPAAWAPAEGEELAGGGAQMSANLLDGITPTLVSGTTESDGVWHNAGRTSTDGHSDWLVWDLAGQPALATNQTYHFGLSAKGASADADSLRMCVGYKDAAGHNNWVFTSSFKLGTTWQRFEGTAVVPSGMTSFGAYVVAFGECHETWMANPTLSLGSPVPLASSAHTPYATQDHVAAEYATKAALKVTSDAVTAEVEERGKLAGKVGTLESTSGTHTSKLEQLAASITSLVKGESTYTDPDGASATSGIYSLVTQTRDSVTALFGQYTKTADLASTTAVRDAKKAGTDAASAASAAQSTANTAKANAATAQSTANAAKGTADGLATMIRADSTGVTVGKSADGKTYSTGRTRMDADSFDILDKAGNVLSSFGKSIIELGKNSANATISMLAGLVKIQARNDGSNTVASVSSDFLSLDSLWQAVMRAGKETGGAYVEGYAAAIAEVTGKRGSARLYCTQGNGSAVTANNAFTVNPNGYDLSHPEYLAAALLGTGGGGLGVTHSQDAVTMASDLDACGPGVFSYNASTAARPTDYGTCVCIRAGDGTTSTWLFELALPTVGDPLWRRNINGAGWEGWWQWTTS